MVEQVFLADVLKKQSSSVFWANARSRFPTDFISTAWGKPLDITFLDSSDAAGTITSYRLAGTANVINITDLDDLLAQLATLASGRTEIADSMQLWDHGIPDGFQVGSDFITLEKATKPWLYGLKTRYREWGSYLRPTGYLILHNCLVGQNTALVSGFAKHFERSVYTSELLGHAFGFRAAPSFQEKCLSGKRLACFPTPWSTTWSPDWIRCDPDGTVARGVYPPSPPKASKVDPNARVPFEGGFMREPKI